MPKRSGRLLAWLVYGCAGLFILVPLASALLGRGTLLDVGALSAVLPFRAEVGRAAATVVTCRQDTFDYYMPAIAEIKRSLFAGHFPTWAPYEVGGAPLASLPNHGALSPMSLPYLILPLWLAPAYVKLLEFAVAIGGMVLFLRRIGVSRTSGLLAGVVFAGSGFMVMWTNWPHTRVAALIPLLFWALERVVQERRGRDVVLVGAVVASMLLGGFPAIVLFAHTLAAPYVLVRVVMLYRPRPGHAVGALLASGTGVLLGVGLSAVQIIPFAADLGAFDFSSRDETGSHLPLYAAFTVVNPYALGTCVGGEWYGPFNPVEAVGFLGGAAVVLTVVALLLRRRAATDVVPTRFFAISALVLALAIWVGGPALVALQVLPLWSTNFVGRAQSVLGFIVAVLAGAGFDRLSRGVAIEAAAPPRARLIETRRAIGAGLLAIGLCAAAVLVTRSIWRVARQGGFGEHVLVTSAGPTMILVVGAAAVVLAARGSRRARMISLSILAMLITLQGAGFASSLLPGSRVKDFYPVTPTHAYLAGQIGHERYGAAGATMLAPTSDYYELRTPVGHEFTDQRWKDVLAAADPDVQRTVTYSSFSTDLPIEQMSHSPPLDQLAVRYWVASPNHAVGDREPVPDDRTDSVALEEGSEATCSVSGGALRGIRIRIQDSMPVTPDGQRPMLHVAVTSAGVERRGAILLDSPRKPGLLFIAVAGEDLPASRSADVRFWLSDTDGARVFRGQGDQLNCAAVRPTDDGLRLIHTDAGGAVYERLDALPRIRWASSSEVVTDRKQRLEMLKVGVPRDTVLLEDTRLARAAGLPAAVRVLADERERMSVQVDAQAGGYLVVADSIVRSGWRATVDGSPVAIEHGNHAFAAIPVLAGDHVVEIRYVAPGLRLGTAVSLASLAVSVGLLVGPTHLRRRRRPSLQGAGSG